METTCFNEFGVLIDPDFKAHCDKIHKEIVAFLTANKAEITIHDFMILERSYKFEVSSAFAQVILNRQMHKKKYGEGSFRQSEIMRYCFAVDESGHSYSIPVKLQGQFRHLLDLDDDSERFNDVFEQYRLNKHFTAFSFVDVKFGD